MGCIMSKQVKPTDAQLSEYLKLDQEIKRLEKAREAIKSQIKAFGPFESAQFLVEFKTIEQNRVVDAATLLERVGPVKCTELELIKTSTYEKISVDRKETGLKSA